MVVENAYGYKVYLKCYLNIYDIINNLGAYFSSYIYMKHFSIH